MLFAFGYAIVSTFILYLVYLLVSKKSDRFRIRKPLVISIVNFILTVSFLLFFIVSPTSFTADNTIDNTFLYVAFSIFASYFYLLIIPISGVHIIMALQKKVYVESINRYVLMLLSVFSMGIIIYISINIF